MNIEFIPENTSLIPIGELKGNPKNRNTHSEEQIARLCKLIGYQGFRQPIIVSNRTGMIVAGHARLEAAKRLGLTHLPVNFQNFKDETEEYDFLISDNAIQAWAELDLSGINTDIGEFGPFDIDLLGIKGFKVDVSENSEKGIKNKKIKFYTCPNCQVEFQEQNAMIRSVPIIP